MNRIPIVFSPSQQPWNKCAVCGSEQNHCHEIANHIHDRISYDMEQIVTMVIPKLTGTQDQCLVEAVRISDAFINKYGGKGFHIPIHTDAGGNTRMGASAFSYNATGNGHKMACAIHKRVCLLTPWADSEQVTLRPGLYEIRKPIGWTSFHELAFHDKPESAKFIHEHIADFADVIVDGIYEGLIATGYDVVSPFDVTAAANRLVNAMILDGLVIDKEYWFKVLNGEIPASAEFLRTVFDRATDKIK